MVAICVAEISCDFVARSPPPVAILCRALKSFFLGGGQWHEIVQDHPGNKNGLCALPMKNRKMVSGKIVSRILAPKCWRVCKPPPSLLKMILAWIFLNNSQTLSWGLDMTLRLRRGPLCREMSEKDFCCFDTICTRLGLSTDLYFSNIMLGLLL